MLEELAKCGLSSYQWRVILVIFRVVSGWGKREDWISLSQFSRATRLDRGNIYRAIKGLEDRRIVVVNRDYKRTPKYRINKDISEWVVLSLKTTKGTKRHVVVSKDTTLLSPETTKVLSSETTKVLSLETPTSEKKETKETLTKESSNGPKPFRRFGPCFSAKNKEEKRVVKQVSAYRNCMFLSGRYRDDELLGFKNKTLDELKAIHEPIQERKG